MGLYGKYTENYNLMYEVSIEMIFCSVQLCDAFIELCQAEDRVKVEISFITFWPADLCLWYSNHDYNEKNMNFFQPSGIADHL